MGSSFCSKCYAQEGGNIFVDYSKFNTNEVRGNADTFFNLAINAQNEEKKQEFLGNAAAQYYILSNKNPADSYSYIQLARIYDMQKKDSYAKAYFSRALGINSRDADANFHFGNFYYSRNKFSKALAYYQKALKYGRENDADIFKKLGKIYEQLGDLPRANTYYQKSLSLNPKDRELLLKINQYSKIDEEYDKAGYYKRRLRY